MSSPYLTPRLSMPFDGPPEEPSQPYACPHIHALMFIFPFFPPRFSQILTKARGLNVFHAMLHGQKAIRKTPKKTALILR